jgi:AraC-like DNA-binding protein
MKAAHDDTTYGRTFEDALLREVTPVYARLADGYRAAWGVDCVLTDAVGKVVAGGSCCRADCEGGEACKEVRAQAIQESARWGVPYVLLCPNATMVWAVPVMQNQRVLGGLVAAMPDPRTDQTTNIHQASLDLLQRAEEANLTNSALLHQRRQEARRESEKAEAIHALKDQSYHSIREIYLVEEPALISAIKQGDRPTAREIINRILVGIYFRGRERPLLLKSFLLELVVMMSRTAVEAGADPTELLGANYSAFADLARIEGEEELTAWLVGMLERTMDAISTHHRYPVSVLLSEAVRHMREHSGEDLSRDDVARVACLSPAHFSRVLKQTFGQSFTEILARIRVDRAREMLSLTEKSLVQIGLECGFSDQSYFTKVFQKYTGLPPGEYRRQNQQRL